MNDELKHLLEEIESRAQKRDLETRIINLEDPEGSPPPGPPRQIRGAGKALL